MTHYTKDTEKYYAKKAQRKSNQRIYKKYKHEEDFISNEGHTERQRKERIKEKRASKYRNNYEAFLNEDY